MAHNGGNGPPPPLRLGPTVQTARLLPRNANIHSNILLPQLASSSSLLPSLHRSGPPHTHHPHQQQQSPVGGDSRNVITLDQPRPGVARARNEYIDTPLRTPLPSLAPNQQNISKKGSSPTYSSSSSIKSATDQHLLLDDGGGGTTSALADVHTLNYRDHYHHLHSNPQSHYHHHHHHRPLNHLLLQPSPPHHDGRPQTLRSPASQRLHQPQHNTHGLATAKPIVSQPCSTLKKQTSLTAKRDVSSECSDEVSLSDVKDDSHKGGDSIICPECGRCRCDACRNTRPLPSTWICSESYQCSAETVVDQCTCMCCIKGLFYHCCKDSEMDSREVSCADKPCSCSPHHRWMRWGTLCLFTAVCPCLLCYWPMRACLKLCEACHTRFTSQGCRCSPASSNNTSKMTSPVGSDNDDDLSATYRRKNVLDATTVPLKAHRLLDPTV